MLGGEAVRRSLPTSVNYRKNDQSQTPGGGTPTGKNDQLRAPKGKEVHCVSYRKSTTPALSQGKGHHPELLPLSNGLLFKTTPPNALVFSLKSGSALVCWIGLCFCCSLFVLDSKSLLFPKKPIVCW